MKTIDFKTRTGSRGRSGIDVTEVGSEPPQHTPGSVQGASRERPGSVRGASGSVRGPSRERPGAYRERPGASWSVREASGERPGSVRERPGSVRERPGSVRERPFGGRSYTDGITTPGDGLGGGRFRDDFGTILGRFWRLLDASILILIPQKGGFRDCTFCRIA